MMGTLQTESRTKGKKPLKLGAQRRLSWKEQRMCAETNLNEMKLFGKMGPRQSAEMQHSWHNLLWGLMTRRAAREQLRRVQWSGPEHAGS